jgi:hypothetical protein
LEAGLFLTNGQTVMAKLVVAFPNFANAFEKEHSYIVSDMLYV